MAHFIKKLNTQQQTNSKEYSAENSVFQTEQERERERERAV